MLTYKDCEKLWKTCRNKNKGKPIANNTRLVKIDDQCYGVLLYDTIVVYINKNGTYNLNTGGWYTMTTKARIQEFSPARIWNSQSTWYVFTERYSEKTEQYVGGPSKQFYNGIAVNSKGMPINYQLDIVQTINRQEGHDRY